MAPGAQGRPPGNGFSDGPVADLLEQLRTTPAGLTSEEAARRLRLHGPNSLSEESRFASLVGFLRFFANPLVIILLDSPVWFVESLATQTLVVFVIRTAGNPFRSRPSRPLLLSVLAVVAIACALPYTPRRWCYRFEPYRAYLSALGCREPVSSWPQ